MSQYNTNDTLQPLRLGSSLTDITPTLGKSLASQKLPSSLNDSITKAMHDTTNATRTFNVPCVSSLISPNSPDTFGGQSNYARQMIADEDERNRELRLLNRQSWHQLIILGNGFDLECGLPSSFGDFLTARKQALGPESEDDANPLGFTETIWDILLSNLGDASWCDIESAIAKWIIPDGGRSLFQQTLLTIEAHQGHSSFTYDQSKIEDLITIYLHETYPCLYGKWSGERLLELTRSDLTTLEQDFCKYLSRAVETTDGYENKALELMRRILAEELPDKDDYDIENSVLSFNYTKPFSDLRTNRGQEGYEHTVNYVNIHGRLDRNDIVFGIDGTGHTDDSIVLPFTKTYRLMALDVPDTATLIHIPSTLGLTRDNGTRMIKFYGHSLGEADYSYFQAIFDTVKLYEGRTRLVFYYRPYGKKTSQDVRIETMHRVIHLLNGYSKTLDNEEHGRNLIHKLLIDGRLSVKELPR